MQRKRKRSKHANQTVIKRMENREEKWRRKCNFL